MPEGVWDETSRYGDLRNLQARRRRRSLPALPLHDLETHRSAADDAALRRAEPRGVRAEALADEHPAAGARPAQRGHLRRSRARPRRTHDAGSGTTPEERLATGTVSPPRGNRIRKPFSSSAMDSAAGSPNSSRNRRRRRRSSPTASRSPIPRSIPPNSPPTPCRRTSSSTSTGSSRATDSSAMNSPRELLSSRPDGRAIQESPQPAPLLRRGGTALGTAALAGLLGRSASAAEAAAAGPETALPQPSREGEARHLPFPVRRPLADGPLRPEAGDGGAARRQGPARIDPPGPAAHHDDSGQKSFPVAPSIFKFAQHGQSGAWMWMSELLPHLSGIADDLCFIRSMHTEAINHDPAITFCQTGHQLAGRPSIGAWLSYGLGTDNADLPAYVVLTSFGTGRRDDSRSTTGCGPPDFSPTQHQGVKFRNIGDPVLYLSDPRRNEPGDAPRHARRTRRPQPPRPRAVPRPRDRCAHFPIRDGLPHAEQACPS